MAKIKIDVNMLADAMEDHSESYSWYLDKHTGEIVMCADEFNRDKWNKYDAERIESEPERFLCIEPLESHELFGTMEDFLAELEDGEPKKELINSLNWRHPFRAFKDTLCSYPDLREQWFEFHNQWLHEKAKEWIEEEQIDAELVGIRQT
jgi:hypothetical protein